MLLWFQMKMYLQQEEKIVKIVTENRCGSNERVRATSFVEIQDLVSLFTRLHQMLQYNSEACEAMRKIILDSKAHGEALSREFDGDKSKEQIGSRRIISSIALLLSKLQRAGNGRVRLIRHYFYFLHSLANLVYSERQAAF
jgi:hypothetical protein